MCSIYGAVGHSIDDAVLMRIRDRAKDRGRDGGRLERVPLTNGMMSVLGNWRATPTTEVNAAPFQPYGGIVHNGTIANDAELGARPGEVDSMVLPRVLARTGLRDLVESLGRVRGSYALAVRCEQTVLLASNFKPIYFLALGGTLYFSSMERHLAPEAPRGVRPARLAPYTAMDLVTGEVRPLPRETNRHALVVCSSGLDSTTAAYALAEAGWQVTLLHFLYGCHAETQEARLVRAIGAHLRAPVAFLSIDYSQFKGNSPLLNDVPIADGLAGAEYAHEWVPARNLLLIAHAVAYAEAHGMSAVALGNNLEEGGAYPDNEEEFTTLLDGALDYAVHDGGHVRLLAPVGRLMKHEIVALGHRLGAPFQLTWSCYRGGEQHCGACGPCHMRRIAFERNGLSDPVFEHASA
jgi:7-cyano-7-deazaguanine synthase